LAARPDEPVFVHCRRGADRTGAVIAAYHAERRQGAQDGLVPIPTPELHQELPATCSGRGSYVCCRCHSGSSSGWSNLRGCSGQTL